MQRRKLYFSILAIPLLGGVAVRLLRVVVAFFLRDLGATVFEITVLGAVFMLTRGILSPILGKLADRGWNRFIILSTGFLGLAIDSTLYLHASYPVMLLLRALDGMFSAMVWPTMQAYVHFSSPQSIKGRLMSTYYIMGGLGGSIGYLLYSALIGNIRYAIITVSLLYLLGIALSLPFRELSVTGKKEVREALSRRTGIFLYTLSLFYGMFFALGSEVILFYLAEIMGMGRELTTLLLSAASMVALLGTFMVGHITDKFSYRHAIWCLTILSLLAGLFIMINNIFIVMAGTIIFFISGRGFLPISRSFAASSTKNVGTSIGLLNLTSNIGSVISPLIGGALLDFLRYSQIFIFNLSALFFFILSLAIFGNTYLLYREG